MKWLNDQITLNNKQAISELQMLFQNRDLYLFGQLTQPMLNHKQQIHFYITLLTYQTMPIYHAVISRLEMEINILIFTLNQLQIHQEFTEK